MGNQEKHLVSRGAWAKGFFLFYLFLVVNGDLYTYFHAPVKPLMRVLVLLPPTGMENDQFLNHGGIHLFYEIFAGYYSTQKQFPPFSFLLLMYYYSTYCKCIGRVIIPLMNCTLL